MSVLLSLLTHQIRRCLRQLRRCLLQWTKPTTRSLLGGTLTDLTRTRAELLAENALVRQQLVILRREAQASNVYQVRSTPPAIAGAGRQELVTGALHCAARDPPQLAPPSVPLVLEATI